MNFGSSLPLPNGSSFSMSSNKFSLIVFNVIFKSGETFDGCEGVGVINTVPIFVSSLQVTEALKILMNKAYCKKLIRFDVWNNLYELFEL